MFGTEAPPARERAERYAEFVELTDQLLRSPTTTYHGRHFTAVDVPMQPGCVQQPRAPFVIAGSGPTGLRLAVAHGTGWVTTGDRSGDALLDPAAGAALVRGQIARLEDTCHAAGRDPATLDRYVLTGLRLDAGLGSAGQFRDALGRYEEAGATDLVVHWPRPGPPFAGDVAAFEAAVSPVLDDR